MNIDAHILSNFWTLIYHFNITKYLDTAYKPMMIVAKQLDHVYLFYTLTMAVTMVRP